MKIWVLEENLKSCLVVVSTEKLLKSTNFGIEHYILYTFTIYYIVRLKNFGINVELKVQIVRRVHLTIKGCYIWCLLQYYFEQISEMNETNFIEKNAFLIQKLGPTVHSAAPRSQLCFYKTILHFIFCCCLHCSQCSNWKMVVGEILAFGNRLHCREFSYLNCRTEKSIRILTLLSIHLKYIYIFL